jgi:sugar O-acyltransferase (sialic acid O-acetyltransferase NeuD family)
MGIPILIPLLNPNEPEALLASLHVQEGQAVQAGAPLCTLETTKSTAELTAEAPGYVVGIRSLAGQTVKAGDTLAYLADTADWQPPSAEPLASGLPGARPETSVRAASQALPSDDPLPAGLRITQPALALARQHSLDLTALPREMLVTEQVIRARLDLAAPGASARATAALDPQAILVYGAGGHGKSLVDLLRLLRVYRIVGFIDDGRQAGDEVMGLPLLGGAEALSRLFEQGVRQAVNAVGGIGNLGVRLQVFERLAQAGFSCPALVHPAAWVESSAVLAAGCQVFALAYVGSEARLGYGCIVNSGALVSHDCQVGEYANLSPGAILAGEVQVGARALVGMGVTVNLRVRIGAGARIGNGATVKTDVPDGGLVRAGTVWG